MTLPKKRKFYEYDYSPSQPLITEHFKKRIFSLPSVYLNWFEMRMWTLEMKENFVSWLNLTYSAIQLRRLEPLLEYIVPDQPSLSVMRSKCYSMRFLLETWEPMEYKMGFDVLQRAIFQIEPERRRIQQCG